MNRDKVILDDRQDVVLGEMEKLKAHQLGHLHRAFSIFIFNHKGQLLLQQRAEHKYHGAGLWTNTCCSHPQWEENVLDSARERLFYEMGIDCDLHFSHSFIYKIEVENNLIEHEYDYVFVGFSNDTPNPNKDEVQNYKWLEPDKILRDILQNSDKYTYWFKVALPQVIRSL